MNKFLYGSDELARNLIQKLDKPVKSLNQLQASFLKQKRAAEFEILAPKNDLFDYIYAKVMLNFKHLMFGDI